jgi:hypothetical protein
MLNGNSFRSEVMLGRAICITLNRNHHIPIFKEFIESHCVDFERKFVTLFISIKVIILNLALMDKINLTVFHITGW